MAEEKKKGMFSKLFGGKKSSCCNIRIEEIEEEKTEGKEHSEVKQESTCCGGSQSLKSC